MAAEELELAGRAIDATADQRRRAYASDIVYATANEIGFDYLRDQLALYPKDQVHRPFGVAVVDEADSILIDEMFRAAGMPPPRWAVRCESIPGLIAIVARTNFIATVPKPLLTLGLAGDLLEIVRVRERLAVSTVSLFAKRDSPLTPAAARFAKFVKDAARQMDSSSA